MAKETTPSPSNPAMEEALLKAFQGLTDSLDPSKRGHEMKKAMKPENQSPPRISALNPRGDKDFARPKLKYARVNIPYRTEAEDLTREEIELINLLTKGYKQIERNDGSTATISVRIVNNDVTDKPEELWLISASAFSAENRLLLPALSLMLRQMIGEEADQVMTMKEERRLVEEGKLPVSVGS